MIVLSGNVSLGDADVKAIQQNNTVAHNCTAYFLLFKNYDSEISFYYYSACRKSMSSLRTYNIYVDVLKNALLL